MSRLCGMCLVCMPCLSMCSVCVLSVCMSNILVFFINVSTLCTLPLYACCLCPVWVYVNFASLLCKRILSSLLCKHTKIPCPAFPCIHFMSRLCLCPNCASNTYLHLRWHDVWLHDCALCPGCHHYTWHYHLHCPVSRMSCVILPSIIPLYIYMSINVPII